MRKRRPIAVLVSGGLDSAALVAEQVSRGQTVLPVFVRQHLKWESVELRSLRRFLQRLNTKRVLPLRVLDLPMEDVYGAGHWSAPGQAVPGERSRDAAVFLPGRNLTLVVKAAVLCAQLGIERLLLGTLKGNPFPDASADVFRQWEGVLRAALGRRLHLETPYRHRAKAEVIRRNAGAPLELTFSCLSPVRGKHCGRCNKCAERRRAFRRAAVEDRTRYASTR